MQIPRPFTIKVYNEGCPNYPINKFIIWTPCKDTAIAYAKELHNRRDFCPLQPRQFLTACESTAEDQKESLKTFHGHVKV